MPAVRLTLQAATANRSVVCSRHPKARGCAAGALATPAAEEPPSWGATPPDPLVAAAFRNISRRADTVAALGLRRRVWDLIPLGLELDMLWLHTMTLESVATKTWF